MSYLLNPYILATAGSPTFRTVDYDNVVLACLFDGSNGSTLFPDDSKTNPKTLTAASSAVISTSQSKFGGASARFNGIASVVSAPDSADWNFGSGPFAIIGWARHDTTGTNFLRFLCGQYGGGSNAWGIFRATNGSIQVWLTNESEVQTIIGSNGIENPVADTWHHFLVERDGSNIVRVFVNGIMTGKATWNNTMKDSTVTFRIGKDASNNNTLLGYLDDLVIIKGDYLWGSDNQFTVPTEPYPREDRHFANVVLLAGFEGVDGATSAIDHSNSGHTLTFNNNAQIDTAVSKFGGGSLLLTRATNDFVSVVDHVDWAFGSGDFTIEAWVRYADVSTWQTIISQWGAAGNEAFLLDKYTDGQRGMFTSNGSTDIFTQANATFSVGTWYHKVYERNGSTLRIYRDGVMRAKSTNSSTMFNSTAQLRIGALHAALPNHLDGWVEEVRITKGVSRYNSDGGHVVPTARYPRL